MYGAADAGEVVGDALADLAKGRITDALDCRAAVRRFEDLGEQVARRVLDALAAQHPDRPAERWEPILGRVRYALAGNLTADFVLSHRLDPARLFAALKAVPAPSHPPLPADDEPLLDDALRAAARFLAAVANTLPGFDTARVRHFLGVCDSLQTDVVAALDEVRAIRDRVDRLAGPPADVYESDYRQAVSEGYNWVELFGADLPPELCRVRLQDAYVTLTLEDGEGDESDNGNRPTTESVFADLLPQTGRLVVRGAAGGGKTTLVRWAAITAARMTPAESPEFERRPDGVRVRPDAERDRVAGDAARDWRQRVPFVISLRDCPGGVLPAPAAFPGAVARNLADPPADWVRQTLAAGRGLVLIDGVDEVPSLNRHKLRAAVTALVAAFPRCYFVLTTRPEAVPPGWLAAEGFREVAVDILSPDTRNALVRRWFEAVARGRRPTDGAAGDWQEEARGLIAALGQTPGVAALVTNPLLCAMACALYQLRRATLPADLPAMCETLTEVMLHRRDQERRVELSQYDPYPLLSYKQKMAAVRQVAFHMVQNEWSTLPVPVAEAQVARALDGLPGFAADQAGNVFRGLLERGGLWREATPAVGPAPATIEFLHNTFKEFLAGGQMADEGNAGLIVGRLNDSGWRQVGLFAVAAGDKRFQNAFLGGLLGRVPDPLPKATQQQPDDHAVRQLAFYALQCYRQATQCEPANKARLEALTGQLMPPRNMTDAACLAAGGNSAVPLLQYQKRAANTQAACVRALALIDTPEARDALRPYWQHETRQTVGTELRDSADPFDMLGDQLVRMLESGQPVHWWVTSSIGSLGRLVGNLKLTALDLRGARVTDLTPLADLGNLQSLHLWNCLLTSLEPLAGLTRLQTLDLRSTRVFDLSPLRRLTALADLDLSQTRVIDLASLAGCVALRRLKLSHTPVADLGPLAALDRLEYVDLACTQVNDVLPLRLSKQLRELSLWNTRLTTADSLAGLITLRSLNIGYTGVASVAPLAGLINLQHLDLSYTRVTDVSPLAGMSDLKTLRLLDTPVADTSTLSHLTDLRVIRS